MKQITVAASSLFLGDEVADLLLGYAVLVAQIGGGDCVRLHTVDPAGEESAVGLLVNSGSTMLVADSRCTVPEPDNRAAVAYLRRRLAEYDGRTPFTGTGAPGLALI